MLFIILSTQQANRARTDTRLAEHRLDPRLIDAGPQAGKWALPARVLDDYEHRASKQVLERLTIVDLDPAQAWPDQNVIK